MNKAGTSNSKDSPVYDDDIFDDSSFLANFEESSFKEKSQFFENNINESLNTSGLNVSALCCDEELSGYDKLTGKTWIYPTNYPVRDYQFNIIKAAIVKNTLVSLPTGLGKTFIAAVIMYNFYRWYPLGKIVFTAPTRPLVAQQIEACYNIIAIPPNDTIEMTGHMQVNTRKAHWQSKRVFFATPQVIYNDIMSGICPGDKIRCLVIDEAHRARGNYAYCQIVSSLTDMGHKTYRILALSATPGSKVEDVINVVKNLHIAHLELRTENCIDVAPYSHSRKINTVIVQLGPQLTQVRHQYVEIIDGYARRLKQLNILPHNLGNLSKGRVVMLYKEYQTKERSARHPQYNYIMKDFTLLIALYHGLELLVKHGLRVFLNFFDEHPEKSWMQADDHLTALLERLRDDLGVNPLSLDRSILPDGSMPEMPKDLCFGHPKFDKLKEIMMDHFIKSKKIGQDTRAIVFCEYRESVNLVHCLLLQCRPLITPQMFVGQGASGKDGKTVVSQKQQMRVMRSFREGACNALVATCVAEEGLDVGSVDLIVCFDISSRSPIRLVQRCGRTGRERGGQVFILVTEGREHQTLIDCIRQRDGLNRKVLQSREVEKNLYKNNPRLIPHDFMPRCQKMHITVAKKPESSEKNKDSIEKSKKGQKDLRTMLLGRASSGSSSSSNKECDVVKLITEEEFNDVFPDGFRVTKTFTPPREYWAMSADQIKAISKSEAQNEVNMYAWLEWQRSLQKTVNIDHSTDSNILAYLLQFSDAKRFDLPPSTQNPVIHTQDFGTQHIVSSPAKNKQTKKKSKVIATKSPSKKDGDIRALFSTATKSTKSYTKLINDLGIQGDGSLPTHLINLLVDLSLSSSNTINNCYICDSVCDCSLIFKIRENRKQTPMSLNFLTAPKLPSLDLLDDIDTVTLLKIKTSDSGCTGVMDQNIDASFIGVTDKNCSGNFDLEFDFISPDIENSLTKNVIEELNNSKSNFELKLDTHSSNSVTKDKNSENNFEIGDLEDIFAESSPEENIQNALVDVKDKDDVESKPKDDEALQFFGLDSIDDIFADDESIDNRLSTVQCENKEDSKMDTSKTSDEIQNKPDLQYPGSPSILSGRQKPTNIPTSPILCSQVRKFQLSTKKKRPQSTPLNEGKQNDLTLSSSAVDVSNKSLFTITQLVDMINKTDAGTSKLQTSSVREDSNLEVHEQRSDSPILLTQADKKKSMNASNSNNISSTHKQSGSLIILESDSDSADETQLYDVEEELHPVTQNTYSKISDAISPMTSKRKLDFDDDDFLISSPYFNKKPKLDSQNSKPLTLQEKVLAALSSNKLFKNDPSNKPNNSNMNFLTAPEKISSQKENHQPMWNDDKISLTHISDYHKQRNDDTKKSNLEMLQMFRRESKIKSPKSKLSSLLDRKTDSLETKKRRLSFDSDDDFVSDERHVNNVRSRNGDVKNKSITNHKVRKKKKNQNEYLDLEAELTQETMCSGDELSDSSAGSLVDFICDDEPSHNEDIHGHYLRSVKSPVNGIFKIPELPKRHNNNEIFSQIVEEDAYEMDSFCVDSHIGLTQVNDISELELAEIVLEEKRKAKKKVKSQKNVIEPNGDSPLIRRKHNPRKIQSDSEDSS